MRISHKRNIQRKLHKQKPLFSHPVFAVKKMPEVELVIDTPVIADTAISKPVTASKSAVRLTPKQQQVFDIVVSHADGLNPKGIGLQAGQDESKAASWATGVQNKGELSASNWQGIKCYIKPFKIC